MARDDVQINVRLPADLKRRLDEAASGEGRSLTAEVVARLTGSFRDVEALMLENRQRELAVVEAELERVQQLVEKLALIRETGDPDFEAQMRYRDRLSRYRELISGGVQWILDARHPLDGGAPAEVHEFPAGKRSTR